MDLCDKICVIENGIVKKELKNTKTKTTKNKLEEYLL
jgi:hypothetical protein